MSSRFSILIAATFAVGVCLTGCGRKEKTPSTESTNAAPTKAVTKATAELGKPTELTGLDMLLGDAAATQTVDQTSAADEQTSLLKKLDDVSRDLRAVEIKIKLAKADAVQKDEDCKKLAASISEKERALRAAIAANPEHKKDFADAMGNFTVLRTAQLHLASVQADTNASAIVSLDDIKGMCPACATQAASLRSGERISHLSLAMAAVQQVQKKLISANRQLREVDSALRSKDQVISALASELESLRGQLDKRTAQLPDLAVLISERDACIQKREKIKTELSEFLASRQSTQSSNQQTPSQRKSGT